MLVRAFVVLEWALIALLLYLFFGFIFLFAARLEKGANGNLIINSKSWHFKLAYPFLRSKYEMESLRLEGTSVCEYWIRVFSGLVILSPLAIIFESFKTIFFSIPCFLFGYYVIPSVSNLIDSLARERNPFQMKTKKFWLPKVGGARILPFYPVLIWILIVFGKSVFLPIVLHMWPHVLVWLILIIFVVGLIYSLSWFSRTNQKTVSLVREVFIAKKRGICKPCDIR